MTNRDTVIEVEELRKTYGAQVAVDGVSFAIQGGEIFGLLGPNGAGKTTTVECLQGLRRPDGGRAQVLGLNPQTQADRLRRKIGSQLQDSALPDRLRVREALDLFAALSETQTDVDSLLADWGLEEKADAAFGSLSGGQRQRLFIAVALVNRPEVVFLDELTTGLDPQARRATWELILRVRDRGSTVVLVTHFMEEAEYLCDRVAIIDRGQIVALDTPAALTTGGGADVRVTFTGPPGDWSWLTRVPDVSRVVQSHGKIEVTGAGPVAVRVAAALAERGIEPEDFRTHHRTLEDVFLSVTGHSMREVR